jgi:hypothetical protein
VSHMHLHLFGWESGPNVACHCAECTTYPSSDAAHAAWEDAVSRTYMVFNAVAA